MSLRKNDFSVVLVCFLIAYLFSIGNAFSQQAGGKKKKAPHPFSWNDPLPDSATKLLPKGVRHESFLSPSMKVKVGYYIYVPPQYEDPGFSERLFPVVFHLHGGRPGSEGKSVKLAQFVDDAVGKKQIQPTIYVYPNGGPVSWYNYPEKENGMGEDVFINELIPHIQKTYRTRELALEGFSQGGRGTARIMLRHPELFVSAAPGGGGYATEKKISENNGAESESLVFAKGYNTWDLAKEYAKRNDKERLPILIWVGTKGFNYENNLQYSDYLKSLKIPHEKLIVEGVDHSATRIYEKRGLDLMKFHQQSFPGPK